MASSILECIGDDEEGENPEIPGPVADPDPKPTPWGYREEDPKNVGKAGHTANLDFLGEEEPDTEKKKKSKDSSIAMFAANLASKFKK